MAKAPIIGISMGDMNGIGPEIILKSLQELDLKNSTPVIFAPKEVVTFYTSRLFFTGKVSIPAQFHFLQDVESTKPKKVNILPVPLLSKPEPGKLSANSGKMAMLSIEKGVELARERKIDALVTAPISKEAVNLAGYQIHGHTEFLAEKTNTEMVLMMLVTQELRVALVTSHIPIRQVAETIEKDLIIKKAKILHRSLKYDFRIDDPKIAVLGLNPHAGDGGIIGLEENEIITPAIKALQQKNINAAGPFAADGFFGNQLHKNFDAILAMYHDQGLAPFKLLSFGKGVNFTAGLPIIRTSPDHGTAFDIAGKGKANPSSFKEAYNLAVKLAGNRSES